MNLCIYALIIAVGEKESIHKPAISSIYDDSRLFAVLR
jgi:hypothetical protein